jgi:hypothetical protein
LHPQARANVIEYLAREKRNLSLVVFGLVEESVPANAMSGDALNLVHGTQDMFSGRLSVMAKEAVP